MKTPLVACLQTRLEHFARESRKRRNKGKFSYPQQKHRFIKREIDSMNDCFEFMEEPIHWTTIDPNEDMLTCFNKQVKGLQEKHEFGGVIKVSFHKLYVILDHHDLGKAFVSFQD